jgi:polyferredoxin
MDVYNTADVEEYNTEDVEEDDQCDCRCCGSCMDAMGSISRVTNLEQRMIQLIAQVAMLTLSEDHCRLRRCGCCTKDVVWREFERWSGLRLLDDQMLRLQQVVVAELENKKHGRRWKTVGVLQDALQYALAMVRNLQADVTQLQILVCEQMNLLRDDKYVSSLESTSRRQARIYFATTSKN